MPSSADQVLGAPAQKQPRPIWRSVALAVLLHLLLSIAIFWSWRNAALKAEDDAAPAQVGLWTAADIAAVTKPVEKTAPQPEIKQPKRPAEKPHQEDKQPEDADIHLGSKKPHKAKATPTPKPEPSPKPTAKPERASAAEKQVKAQEQARKAALARMLGQAKADSPTGGSTTSKHDGQGKAAYKPSNDYLARIGAIIKRNTVFDAGSVDGNPAVIIEVRLSPDGTVLGQPRIVRSSGQSAWDDAAVDGIVRAERLPRDPSLGTAPARMEITRRPKD